MTPEEKQQLEDLKNQVDSLKRKIEELNNPATISEQFLDALVKKGFLRYSGPNVLTYVNPSGREFWNGLVKFSDTSTLLSLDNYSDSTGVKRVSYFPFTANSSTDVLTAVNHGMSDGTNVRVYTTGNIPGGLSPQAIYYVVSATTNTFKLSLSLGGAAVNITSNGGPYNYIAYI